MGKLSRKRSLCFGLVLLIITSVFVFIVPDDVRAQSGISGKRICIDPGHGGNDPGALGYGGIPNEEDINLDVALKLKGLLEAKGATVIMTRSTDKKVNEPPTDQNGDGKIDKNDELEARCKIANNANADIFVSIHCNSFGDSTVHGTETYWYTLSSAKSGLLATNIQNKLIEHLGRIDRGVKQADFYVLHYTNMPAALAELMFISNKQEWELLKKDSVRLDVAETLCDAIYEYFVGNIIFEDDFNDNSIDSNLWFTYGKVYEQNQRLEFDSTRISTDRIAGIRSISTFTGLKTLELTFKKGGYIYKSVGLTDGNLVGLREFNNGGFISWDDYGPIFMGIIVNGVEYIEMVDSTFWSRTYTGEYNLTITHNQDGTFTMNASANGKYWEHTTTKKLPLTLPLRVDISESVWEKAWWLWERYIDNVRINELLIADAGGEYKGFEGFEISFDASGSSNPSGDPIQYKWNFGDGTITDWLDTDTIFHTYTNIGEYIVTLTISDGYYWGKDTANVKIVKLSDEAAKLAKEVLGAPYLGDGNKWGGKGEDCSKWPKRLFVYSTEIKQGYYYYDARIPGCSNDKEPGVDCSGLIFWSYNRAYFNEKILSSKEYEKRPLYYEGANGQYRGNTDNITKQELVTGDLLFYNPSGNTKKKMTHVMMYVGSFNHNGETYNVIHASGFTNSITPASYNFTTEEIITLKPNGESQSLKITDYGRVREKTLNMKVIVKSPVELIVTDPEGETITIDMGESLSMAYMIYDIDGDGKLDDIVAIPENKVGYYIITVKQKDDASQTDTYTLEVSTENEIFILANNLQISDIPSKPYRILSSETGINIAPIANIGGPYEGDEGDSILLDASGSIDPDNNVLQYRWDFNNDGNWDTDWSSVSIFSNIWYDNLFSEIKVEISDGDNIESDTTTITINNVDPMIDMTKGNTGPQPSFEGGSVKFEGFELIDPGDDSWTYFWDFNGDDIFDANGSISNKYIPEEEWIYDDDYNGEASLIVLDDDDGSSKSVTYHQIIAKPANYGTGYVSNYGYNYLSSSIQYKYQYYYDFYRGWAKIDLSEIPDNAIIEKVVFNGYISSNYGVNTVGVRQLSSDPTKVSGNTIFSQAGSGTRLFGLTNSFGSTKIDMGTTGITLVQNALINDWIGLGFDIESPASFGIYYGYMQGFSSSLPSLTIDYNTLEPGCLIPIEVKNVPPSIIIDNQPLGEEGSKTTFKATASDPGKDDITFNWNWGDDTTDTKNYYDNNGNEVIAIVEHTYGDNADYTVTLTVSDDDGGYVIYATIVSVDNVAPTINPLEIITANEGTQFTATATATDPGSDDLTFEWDLENLSPVTHTYYNDGSTPDPGTSPGGTYPFIITDSVQNTYYDNGIFEYTLTVNDDDEGITSYTSTNNVNNLPPVVDAGYDQIVNRGESAIFCGSFSDPGTEDTHTIEWDFSDGNTAIGTMTPSNEFNEKGLFVVELTITDDDGGVGTDTLTINVVAPTADTGSDKTVDEGEEVQFDGSNSVGSIILTEPTMDPSVVTLWHINEGTGDTIYDETVNGKDGSINGATWTTEGKFESALSFDGVDDYVEIDDSSSLSFGNGTTDSPFSIEAWIKMYDATKFRIVAKDHLNGGNGLEYVFNVDVHDSLAINLYDGVYSGNRIGVYTPLNSMTPFENEFIHVAMTYDGSGTSSGLYLYLNGVQQSSVLNDGGTYIAMENTIRPLWIGACGQSGFAKGIIDEVAIYDRALSAQEILDYFNSNKEHFLEETTNPVDIVSYEWDFESDGNYDYLETATNAPDGNFDGKTTHTYGDNGVFTVTLKVIDERGAMDTEALSVTVNNVAPSVNAGIDQVVECCIEVVSFSGSFTDPGLLDSHTILWEFGDGATKTGTLIPSHKYCALGEYTVTLTITDDDEGVGTDTLVVTVVDTTPPEISVEDDPIVLWPPNHKYHTIEINDFVASVSDICDSEVGIDDIIITSVSSDEPEDVKGGGDGNTEDDIVIVDFQTVNLRAERQGGGNGRVYTINFEVTDISDNTKEGSFTVCVPHDKKDTAVDDGAGAGYKVST